MYTFLIIYYIFIKGLSFFFFFKEIGSIAALGGNGQELDFGRKILYTYKYI